ncbi:MAG: hypothetical protein J6U20_07595 [Fibrobacter sp.]|nr:hypothetical protein [Fibrobacter sp.]
MPTSTETRTEAPPELPGCPPKLPGCPPETLPGSPASAVHSPHGPSSPCDTGGSPSKYPDGNPARLASSDDSAR